MREFYFVGRRKAIEFDEKNSCTACREIPDNRCAHTIRSSRLARAADTFGATVRESRPSSRHTMDGPFTRRTLLRATAAAAALHLAARATAHARPRLARQKDDGWVRGHLTGAEAVVETLKAEGADCIFGIPGAQENELWDAMKSKGLPYLLVTHELSASYMADGFARATGRPGVICVVPGPGVTNALSGIGEALLDSVPMVCIVGDIARNERYKPFQVHSLNQQPLLESMTKCVFEVKHVSGIPQAIRQAFATATSGEPGPAAVVIPYNLLIEAYRYDAPPLADPGLPWDEAAFQSALRLLSERKPRVGIYAGLGCMDYSDPLVKVAELLQAPVATSVSGKGCFPETHPLAVGWGYGPQATSTAETAFAVVDCVLAIGVRFSEVSTGFYSNPQTRHVIHVDANPCNLGKVMRTDVCVNADAGLFLSKLLESEDCLRRPADSRLVERIRLARVEESRRHCHLHGGCGADPMALVLAMRRCLPDDGLLFVDVTCSEHLAAEAFRVCRPRTYFNPTDNQAMGWSIPAAIGAQRACPGQAVVTLTGDGCFLMTAMEISTAARACLPVKFFVLDDQAYHYMQELQKPAYHRTTATILAHMDYAALAKGFGVAYSEITSNDQIEPGIRGALAHPGPVLVRVCTDYAKLKIRWIEAVRKRFLDELTPAQKVRFAARAGSRALDSRPAND
jgi:acetolactate synthase-1/2/3 large subunit